MKYGWIPFVASLAIWLFAIDVKYFIIQLNSGTKFNYGHGFVIQIAIVVVSIVSTVNYYRYSKIYKRNIDAMQYDEI